MRKIHLQEVDPHQDGGGGVRHHCRHRGHGGRRLRGLIIKQHVLKFVLHVTPLFNITKITRPHAFMHEQPAARETQTI